MVTLNPSDGAAHAAILGVGAYRPSRIHPQLRGHRGDRLLRRVDPGSGPGSRSVAGPNPTRPCRDVRRGVAQALAAPVSTPQIDAVVVATVAASADPRARDGHRPPARRRQRGGVRHLGRLCRILPRRGAGGGHGPRRQRRLRPGHRRGAALGPHRPDGPGTAFIFGDGAGAVVVGPSDTDGHRPGRVGRGRRAVRRDPADPRLAKCLPRTTPGRGPWPCPGSRCSAGRRSRWPRPVSRRWTAPVSPSTSSTASSRTRPTCGSSTRWSAP